MRTYYEKPKREESLSRNQKLELFFDLINSFNIVRNPGDTALFLQDLLTASEIRNLSVRLRIAKLLLKGLTYIEIRQETHASNGTITKVGEWLSKSGGGFQKVISRLPTKYDYPKRLPPGPLEYHLPELLVGLAQFAIAAKQNKTVNRFARGLDEKERSDKELREKFTQEYGPLKKEQKRRKVNTLSQ